MAGPPAVASREARHARPESTSHAAAVLKYKGKSGISVPFSQ